MHGLKTTHFVQPFVIAVTLFHVGCTGSNPHGTVPVSGVVKAEGELVTEGKIMFYPKAGGRPAMGKIGPDGRYELTTFEKADGAVPGNYKVTINAVKFVNGDPKAESDGGEETGKGDIFDPTQKMVWVIPERYSNKQYTTIEAVVEPEGGTIDFDSSNF